MRTFTRALRTALLTGGLLLLGAGIASGAQAPTGHHHPGPNVVRSGTVPAMLSDVPGLGGVLPDTTPGLHSM
ncbi:MAG TPA: hypothetical protein VG756_09525 [Pseudonocardiaceae bacterium]|nr:hypothetical protein [Pseudonocardiaceae bacterium]